MVKKLNVPKKPTIAYLGGRNVNKRKKVMKDMLEINEKTKTSSFGGKKNNIKKVSPRKKRNPARVSNRCIT